MKIEDIPQVLKEIEKAGLTRRVVDYRMKTATRAMDRRGKEYIVFNSNDYLGMTHEKKCWKQRVELFLLAQAQAARVWSVAQHLKSLIWRRNYAR